MSESVASDFEEPVRILSDLHLAHPATLIETIDSLRPLVAGAKTVVFNGDTCELHCAAWREAGVERLAELKNLCSEEGARAVFLPGNHDPDIAGQGWCDLAGGSLFLTHGHAIFPHVAPWSHEYLRRKREIWRIIRERQLAEEDLAYHLETTRLVTEALKPDRARYRGKKGRSYLLSAFWPPARCFHILRVWLTMAGMADRFLTRFRPAARVMLFGHFHHAGIWRRNGRTLCNTGAFMRGSRQLLAESSSGSLRVFRVIGENGFFRPGPEEGSIRIREE